MKFEETGKLVYLIKGEPNYHLTDQTVCITGWGGEKAMVKRKKERWSEGEKEMGWREDIRTNRNH